MERQEQATTLAAAIHCFDAGQYLAAHELFEELWEASEGLESDFFKGFVQAAICLHHFEAGNLEGAVKLYSGHRRCLAPFLPNHEGIDVARFLVDMQRALRPVLDRPLGGTAAFPEGARPRIFPPTPVTPPG